MSDLKPVHEAYYLANEAERNYNQALRDQFGEKETRWTVNPVDYNEATYTAQQAFRYWCEVHNVLNERKTRSLTLDEARDLVSYRKSITD